MKGKDMSDIYTTPLLTTWPVPFSCESFKEFFGLKKKILKRKIKDTQYEMKKAERIMQLPNFLNLF